MKNRKLEMALVNASVLVLICIIVFFIVTQNKEKASNGISAIALNGLIKIDGSSIKFDTIEHDFGIINEADGSVLYTFEFINNGTEDLLIQDVIANCGCTTPNWTKESVKPGAKGFVKVLYDPNERPGPFNKSLEIRSNAFVQQTKLKIKGSVVPVARDAKLEYPVEIGGLRLKYSTIGFEVITNEKPIITAFEVYNDSDNDITFSDQYRAPYHILINFSPQILPPKTVGTIELIYDSRDMELLGSNSDLIEFDTDELQHNVKQIRVNSFLEDYFPPMSSEQISQAPILLIENPSYNFGRVKEGETVTNDFVITNTGKSELIIKQTRVTCGCTATSPLKSILSPGESSTINISFDTTGRSGVENKLIYVFSNDPTTPTQKIVISASIDSDT